MSLLSWFTVTVSVAFIAQHTISVGASDPSTPLLNDVVTDDTDSANGRFRSPELYLAGEDTPVWIGQLVNSIEQIAYKKLEKNTVKRAVDYGKSTDFRGLSTVMNTTTHFSMMNVLREIMIFMSERSEIQLGDLAFPDSQISTGYHGHNVFMENAQLSILIIMDYVDVWPTDEIDQERLIDDMILYAVAFWSAVDIQLRHVRKPTVSLKISGIIISRERTATPYVYNNQEQNGLRLKKAYIEMLEYWMEQATLNDDFPSSGYHIVVTMTNLAPAGFNNREAKSSYGLRLGCDMEGPWKYRYRDTLEGCAPTCETSSMAGGMIFTDDFAFGGIQMAVRETAHTLGAFINGEFDDYSFTHSPHVMSDNVNRIGRKWLPHSLQQISQCINTHGDCLNERREFQPFGKPIRHILPGRLTTLSDQCKARGWKDGIVCRNRSSCSQLFCKNNKFWSKCRKTGLPLDGTMYNTEEMCLDEKIIHHTDMRFIIDV